MCIKASRPTTIGVRSSSPPRENASCHFYWAQIYWAQIAISPGFQFCRSPVPGNWSPCVSGDGSRATEVHQCYRQNCRNQVTAVSAVVHPKKICILTARQLSPPLGCRPLTLGGPRLARVATSRENSEGGMATPPWGTPGVERGTEGGKLAELQAGPVRPSPMGLTPPRSWKTENLGFCNYQTPRRQYEQLTTPRRYRTGSRLSSASRYPSNTILSARISFSLSTASRPPNNPDVIRRIGQPTHSSAPTHRLAHQYTISAGLNRWRTP